MLNMSFALTVQPVQEKCKLITRRLGWLRLKKGDLIQPVLKCMGIPKGGRIERIGGPIRVVSVLREPLCRLVEDAAYGVRECELEGFPHLKSEQFLDMFIRSHKPCDHKTVVTRIEFEYLPEQLALPV